MFVLASAALVAGCSGSYIDYAPLDAAKPLPGNSRVLVITGTHGACDSVPPAEVSEAASEVRVRVPLRVQRGDCRSIGWSLQDEVQLSEPLGDRAVIDAERDVALLVRNG